ncbi:MAG: O-antigen ligase family protein [candidate division WWE3 bacterium]|nr:O-antigen ligase family protein [candidate division WWE3 bacterium]
MNKQKTLNNKLQKAAFMLINMLTPPNTKTTKYKQLKPLQWVVHNLKSISFVLLLFGIIVNWGKHYINSGSYVSGTLVDYLIPTFYFSYLTTLFFISVNLKEAVTNIFQTSSKIYTALRIRRLLFILAIIFIVLVIFSYLLNPTVASLTKTLQLFLMLNLFVVVTNIQITPRDLKAIMTTLVALLVVTALLGLYQFIFQRSLCGYFCFGETNLLKNTYGITTDFFGSVSRILPYGPFPHPNIFGGFLALGVTFVSWLFLKTHKWGYIVFIIFIASIIFITHSEMAILTALLGVLFLLFLKASSKVFKLVWLGSLVTLVIGLEIYLVTHPLVLNTLSWLRRLHLAQSAVTAIKNFPILGLGPNNFIKYLPSLPYNPGFPPFWQPVHNIYLLIASELGVPTLIVIIFIILIIFITVIQSRRYLFAALIAQLLILGFWDHYLWTTPQGLLLFWLTLGVAVSNIKRR